MRVLVVGIDGMDPEVVESLGEKVPFLTRCASFGDGRMTSVFPPDSIPAWASILTGLREDEHGVFGHIDYLSQKTPDSTGGYASSLSGRTFFDAASAQGKRVCVLNPFLAYPPWEVNGAMVSGPLALEAPVLASGNALLEVPSSAPIIGGIEEFPRRNETQPFIDRTAADIDALTDYAACAFAVEPFDLGFVTYLQLDRAQHFLWRFADSGDVTHPRASPFTESIALFYQQLDAACARLACATAAEHVVVLSDHGHGRRCERVVNINEVLRRVGIVRTVGGERPWATKGYWLQKAKIAVLNGAWTLGMEEEAFAIARKLPNKKELKTSSYLHDRTGNLAAASAIGGTNPFGGVDINSGNVGAAGLDAESVTERVAETLRAVTIHGESPFLWIKRREELYDGPFAEEFPAVLFEMKPRYGVGWDLLGPIEGPNVMHRRISGGHRREGFLGVTNAQEVGGASSATVIDVAPTVLGLLGCQVPNHMRGISLASRKDV